MTVYSVCVRAIEWVFAHPFWFGKHFLLRVLSILSLPSSPCFAHSTLHGQKGETEKEKSRTPTFVMKTPVAIFVDWAICFFYLFPDSVDKWENRSTKNIFDKVKDYSFLLDEVNSLLLLFFYFIASSSRPPLCLRRNGSWFFGFTPSGAFWACFLLVTFLGSPFSFVFTFFFSVLALLFAFLFIWKQITF